MTDQLIIIGVTIIACLVVTAVGVLALRVTRRRSLRYSLIIASLTPVLAVVLTVIINVWLMFLSQHDSGVILLALSVSLILATGFALLVTRRVLAGTSRLGRGISRLAGEGDAQGGPTAGADHDLPAELTAVLAELETTRERLTEAQASRQAAERARHELVRHLSHDLRTPLAGLRALAEALEDGMVADVPLAMRQIRTSVGRMDTLVGDLFELSRIQQGPPPREHELLSLSELIIDVADESAAVAASREVTLDVRVPEDDRLAVTGDADGLARALGNLVTNAVRHTAAGELVLVRAGRGSGGDISVAVTDGCGGIPESDLERVFEAGWRGDEARSENGAGLGLAIARGVVESHQGRISVANAEGGCLFAVDLPAPARPGAGAVESSPR